LVVVGLTATEPIGVQTLASAGPEQGDKWRVDITRWILWLSGGFFAVLVGSGFCACGIYFVFHISWTSKLIWCDALSGQIPNSGTGRYLWKLAISPAAAKSALVGALLGAVVIIMFLHSVPLPPPSVATSILVNSRDIVTGSCSSGCSLELEDPYGWFLDAAKNMDVSRLVKRMISYKSTLLMFPHILVGLPACIEAVACTPDVINYGTCILVRIFMYPVLEFVHWIPGCVLLCMDVGGNIGNLAITQYSSPWLILYVLWQVTDNIAAKWKELDEDYTVLGVAIARQKLGWPMEKCLGALINARTLCNIVNAEVPLWTCYLYAFAIINSFVTMLCLRLGRVSFQTAMCLQLCTQVTTCFCSASVLWLFPLSSIGKLRSEYTVVSWIGSVFGIVGLTKKLFLRFKAQYRRTQHNCQPVGGLTPSLHHQKPSANKRQHPPDERPRVLSFRELDKRSRFLNVYAAMGYMVFLFLMNSPTYGKVTYSMFGNLTGTEATQLAMSPTTPPTTPTSILAMPVTMLTSCVTMLQSWVTVMQGAQDNLGIGDMFLFSWFVGLLSEMGLKGILPFKSEALTVTFFCHYAGFLTGESHLAMVSIIHACTIYFRLWLASI